MNCNRCGGDLAIPESSQSEDDDLDQLLRAISEVGAGKGVCQLGTSDRIVGTGTAESQAYHGEQATAVQEAINAVHAYIDDNYERDN